MRLIAPKATVATTATATATALVLTLALALARPALAQPAEPAPPPAAAPPDAPADAAPDAQTDAQTDAPPDAQTDAQTDAPAPTLDCAHGATRVAALVREEYWVDAHLVAQTLDALCPTHPSSFVWRLWDAVALIKLDESPRARVLLGSVSQSSDPLMRQAAEVIHVWSLLADGDQAAFKHALARLEGPARTRLQVLSATQARRDIRPLLAGLEPPLRLEVDRVYRRYQRRHAKRPWLAGTLSAIVPGLGQAYAGSWESAAVSFVLNGVLIGATVELARRDFYAASTVTGLAGSVFYVGSILSAADLARRRNERAAEPERRELERLLVPELSP
jgi:hypothetical protein